MTPHRFIREIPRSEGASNAIMGQCDGGYWIARDWVQQHPVWAAKFDADDVLADADASPELRKVAEEVIREHANVEAAHRQWQVYSASAAAMRLADAWGRLKLFR